MLPLVSRIVEDIVELFLSVRDRRVRLEKIRRRSITRSQDEENPYDEELSQIEDDLEKDIQRIEGYIDELRALNVELKDPAIGLVDFRSRAEDGRDIYLCWKLGEEEITHWHELDAGFAGRQPLLAANSIASEDDGLDEEH
ncbi:MAG: hypothetical protein Tsb009_14840 [Planctomycetaceae bacterium]